MALRPPAWRVDQPLEYIDFSDDCWDLDKAERDAEAAADGEMTPFTLYHMGATQYRLTAGVKQYLRQGVEPVKFVFKRPSIEVSNVLIGQANGTYTSDAVRAGARAAAAMTAFAVCLTDVQGLTQYVHSLEEGEDLSESELTQIADLVGVEVLNRAGLAVISMLTQKVSPAQKKSSAS